MVCLWFECVFVCFLLFLEIINKKKTKIRWVRFARRVFTENRSLNIWSKWNEIEYKSYLSRARTAFHRSHSSDADFFFFYLPLSLFFSPAVLSQSFTLSLNWLNSYALSSVLQVYLILHVQTFRGISLSSSFSSSLLNDCDLLSFTFFVL